MALQLLTQADGYGIIVGLSVLFCLIILAAVRIQKWYLAEDSDQSEMFMVANRSVGTGLTASAVFSSWYVLVISQQPFAPRTYGLTNSFQDVDQRKCLLSRLYLQMGSRPADLVG